MCQREAPSVEEAHLRWADKAAFFGVANGGEGCDWGTVGAISVSKARRILAADGRFAPIEFSFAEIAGAVLAP